MTENNYKSPLEFLFVNVRKNPKAIALNIAEVNLTYDEFFREVKSLASYYATCGVSDGNRIAIYCNNDLLMIKSYFALWMLKACCVPMNISLKTTMQQQIEMVIKPDLGFYSSESDIREYDYSHGFKLIKIEQTVEYEVTETVPETTSQAIIMFTSGTSGVPKAVPITHYAVTQNAWLTSNRLKITETDRLLINTPPYTTSSILHVLTMFSKGGSIVIERGFKFGTDILRQIIATKCTGFGGVPVHFIRILSSIGDVNLPENFRFFMNSGEHFPVPVLKSLLEVFPTVNIYCVYGLTEVAGRLCILNSENTNEKIGSVGFPLEGMSVSICDENGNELLPYEKGEICVNGHLLMSGYLNNPEINSNVIKPWGFKTGDIGHIDSDGFLFISGRSDDVFKLGGEKVSVNLIEEALFDFEDFKEYMVIPKEDPHIGKIPALYYVLKDGLLFDKIKLLKYMQQRLPATHIPLFFQQMNFIPRTSSGKTIRK